MTLEDYLKKKTDEIAVKVAADAPIDSCPHCNVCEGQLIYDGKDFLYECKICGQHWSAERLEIDGGGKFLTVELAD